MNINEVIELTYILHRDTPSEIHPPRTQLIPLPRGTYPVFNKYPTYVVNFQAKERERIMREEEEYLRKQYARCDVVILITTDTVLTTLSLIWKH